MSKLIGVLTLVVVLAVLVVTVVLHRDDRQQAENTAPRDLATASDSTTPHEPLTGRWRRRETVPEEDLTEAQRRSIERLQSLGYLAGSRLAPEQKNVTRYDPQRAYNGTNLYVSGHGPEAILMDMEGRVLHTWRYPFERIWPDYEAQPNAHGHEYWRRAWLMEGGDLLAIFEGLGLIRLDRDSNLHWAYGGRAHHDLDFDAEGNIYVLTRRAVVDRRFHPQQPILEDFITILTPEGEEVRRVSILESLVRSRFADILDDRMPAGDILHTNTLEILDGRIADRGPAFRRDNVLISLLYLHAICVLDMEAEQIVWARRGSWRRQHEPTVLDNGHLLLFDNQGLPGHSRVLELDPVTMDVVWSYRGTADEPFFTFDCGASARLPNGNTLISESNAGRAFEVTPDGTIVWEFYSPHRAGEHGQLIATLCEVVRLGPDVALDWIPAVP